MTEAEAHWSPERADQLIREVLVRARDRLQADPRRLGAIREEDLRTALYEELDCRFPGYVRKENTLSLSAFQGCGPSDLLVDRPSGRGVVWLAETKWSYTAREKIFEAAWDAVKLALAQDEHGVERGWLITGASNDAWAKTECADLFTDGLVDVREMWARTLDPPGPNKGVTVGEDLIEGGRGNMFVRAPKQLRIEHVAEEQLRRGDERWAIRASAVSPHWEWIEDFAPAPLFPARINQLWLRANVPSMSETTYVALLKRLKQKRWTDEELRHRVYPLRER